MSPRRETIMITDLAAELAADAYAHIDRGSVSVHRCGYADAMGELLDIALKTDDNARAELIYELMGELRARRARVLAHQDES
jgi:hypothetical protein